MSGGFFRGTSADQDTRFSNKQAKLLKSQKFAPELEHLVDMTKVKMDVIRPWIAKRATELLGFEDEVLINFVYGLLDKKEVDGKQIQIQLTGFMEKNTGKFMKELWVLLLSAQNNISGVPQQFLDEKEEEARKKKAETDRIAEEIQKRRDRDRDRDGREPERERKSRFEGEANISKFTKAASVPVSKFSKPRSPSVEPDDNREKDGKHDSRVKDGQSPEHRSPSPPRITPSPIRSNNKSVPRSRSYSEERRKSRSLSVSSKSERHSVSPGRHSPSPVRRSFSPKKRHKSPMRSISPRRHSPRDTRSPLRRSSPHLRRRSRSRSRHRSPASIRYRSPRSRRRSPPRRSRSPVHRRSPSPLRRRSPPIRRRSSPWRRRSPSPWRRRSPSPWRRRSPAPFRHRSPSPFRRRSPLKARRRSPSPIGQRPPIQRRSISPVRHKSPSPLRRSSPPRSAKELRRSPLHSPRRSRSPFNSQSPLRRTRRSLSREQNSHVNGSEPRRYRDEHTSQRSNTRKSLVNHALERQISERTSSGQKAAESVPEKVSVSLRSPQRDFDNLSGDHDKLPFIPSENSPSRSESPTDMLKINRKKNRRSQSLSKSPVKRAIRESPRTIIDQDQMCGARDDSRDRTDSSRRRKNLPKDVGSKKPIANNFSPESFSPDRRMSNRSPVTYDRRGHSELKMDTGHRSDVNLSEKRVQQLPYLLEETERVPGREREKRGSPGSAYVRQRSAKLLKRDESSLDRMDTKRTVENKRQNQLRDDDYIEFHHEKEFTARLKKNISKGDGLDNGSSDSEEIDSYGNQNREKRKQKKSDKRQRDFDESSESDSEIEDKKEVKRRRKDEKRLRKEEKRRRREERHRRKLERRSGKLKLKSVDTYATRSDFEKNHNDADNSDSDDGRRKNSHLNVVDETETDQKKLETELREKALESLRAKKAISH